jgi:ABC-type multidrug transport system ATPase subunit
MTTVTTTIVSKGLRTSYGQVHALDGLDLVAEEGSVLAALGPNCSGKTTTVHILTRALKQRFLLREDEILHGLHESEQ